MEERVDIHTCYLADTVGVVLLSVRTDEETYPSTYGLFSWIHSVSLILGSPLA